MPVPAPADASDRFDRAGHWALTAGLALTIAGTTLCLGGNLAVTLIAAGPAVLLLGAAGLGLSLRCRWSWDAADWLPVPFLVYALVSVLVHTPAAWLGWREWLLWLQTAVVFWLARHGARTSVQAGLLAGTLLALGLAGAVMAGYQHFTDPTWLMLGKTQLDQYLGRSAGMFGNPNNLAGLLELLLPACLLVLAGRGAGLPARIAAGWLAASLGFAFILTVSRGGWIALMLVMLAWPLLHGRNWRWQLGGLAAVALLAGLSLLTLDRLSPNVHARLQPFWEGQLESSRPLVWRAGLRLWQEQPWWGTGAASFNVLFERVRPAGFLNIPRWTHNDYLNTLGDYGVIGFLLWAGAGAAVMGLGWRAVSSTATWPPEGWLARREVRTGLWLGLAAFALHLTVDFHTKVPALAWAAAVCAGLLLRPVPDRKPALPHGLARGVTVGAMLALAALAFGRALPLYRAEALRFSARQAINRQAETLAGSRPAVVAAGLAAFREAVRIDPDNGEAWSDLAYATIQSWDTAGVPLADTGRRALVAADRALALCDVSPEFWVRRGAALDMIPDQLAADAAFREASRLAPNSPEWQFYAAYHWLAWPGHEAEGRAVLAHCLSLDPNYAPALRLREKIHAQQR